MIIVDMEAWFRNRGGERFDLRAGSCGEFEVRYCGSPEHIWIKRMGGGKVLVLEKDRFVRLSRINDQHWTPSSPPSLTTHSTDFSTLHYLLLIPAQLSLMAPQILHNANRNYPFRFVE